jgi:hypothetical protein
MNVVCRLRRKEGSKMEKSINFIDSHYNTLFTVNEGEKIVIESTDTDGTPCEYVRIVHILDECHMELKKPNGGWSYVYHICEFAERMEQCGNRYRPYKEAV